MSKTYVTLSGDWITRISESKKLTSADVRQEDFFLISQPVLSNVDPDRTYECNGRVYTNEYRSMNISYEDLSNKVFDDLSTGFGFKSMAWELSNHYSLAGHIHNYSRLSVVPTETPTQGEISAGEVSALGLFSVNTKKKPFYMRRIRMYDAPRPYIGQLKFMALTDQLPTIPNDDSYYGSSVFTGWVYPDGRELDQTMFPEAYAIFGNSYGAASEGNFRIPNLTEFIKPYFPALKTTSLTGTVAAQNVLLAHSHTITKMGLSGTIQCTLSVEHTSNNSWYKPETAGQHGGTLPATCLYTFKTAFTCNNLTCDQTNLITASDESETYPSHTKVPVMIYIGNMKKQDPTSITYDLTQATVSLLNSVTFTGDQIEPTVKVKTGQITLTLNKDYTVNYYDNINVGVATVEINPLGSYYNSTSRNFNILPADIDDTIGEIIGSV